ncbi:hypothetical protein G5V59_07835 [Nocardioides sp. W3-2-3]|uniref:hypothetical protein n=1 Tax=Nocardioides convexus TaxID=2712224 RepID=UPI002418A31E|nr:hypothetical protein [Nocardioides convexus]NHA00105.1 hypothetical protein [Nocardioides convexus]
MPDSLPTAVNGAVNPVKGEPTSLRLHARQGLRRVGVGHGRGRGRPDRHQGRAHLAAHHPHRRQALGERRPRDAQRRRRRDRRGRRRRGRPGRADHRRQRGRPRHDGLPGESRPTAG